MTLARCEVVLERYYHPNAAGRLALADIRASDRDFHCFGSSKGNHWTECQGESGNDGERGDAHGVRMPD